mgnify:CR=1 FL=1
MGSRQGVVKKTALSAFSNPRAGGIIAMGVEEGDAVIASAGHRRAAARSSSARATAWPSGSPRKTSRADGTHGLRRPRHHAAGRRRASWRWKSCSRCGTLLTVTERGYGKRTEIDEYRRAISAAASASSTSPTSKRNGVVVGMAYVEEGDEVLLITQQGMIIRMPTRRRAVDRSSDAGRAG